MNNNLGYRILQSLGMIIISLALLIAGVALLFIQVPFWSLVYGLPAVFLGIMMTILTFNEVAKNRVAEIGEYHQIACRVCGKSTLAPYLIEKTVCVDCQYKMAQKLQIGILVAIAVLAIPLTFTLTQQVQVLYQSAHESKKPILCEIGEWNPQFCRCGVWENSHDVCQSGERERICGSILYCCQQAGNMITCKQPINSSTPPLLPK